MNYRYSVKGIAEKPFILRGRFFRIGATVDNEILETELDFVKGRCRLTKIVDNQKAVSSKPIPTHSSTTAKGIKNELPKSASGTNKTANKAQV